MAGEKLTKKQQKAAQFKAGKRGKGSAVEDHPATPDDIPEDIPASSAPEASTSTSSSKSSKSSKPSKPSEEATSTDAPVAEASAAEAPVKEEKRNKKRKRLAAEAEALAQAGVTPEQPAPEAKSKDDVKAKSTKSKSKSKPDPAAPAKKTTFGDDGEVAAEETVSSAPSTSEPTAKNNKYILFIGNMAFSTTSEYISKHFGQACGETPTVRLLTRKADPNALASLPASKRKSIAKGKALDPTKPQSKGCAFVEFQTSEALRKALKFHHTLLEGRKINVELTAGGGGKGEARQEKIKAKNAGLEKERAKLHAKHVAPKNEERKRRGGAEGGERENKRRRPVEQEKEEGWGRNAGRERKMPRFMATGANAVRVAPTS
ncbi:RNA recognition motif domain protein [Kalmanozyma brasiliensis GHG001]|uniref:RRM domain-containing protein n=1 Tax=Kalmanozyma brasiliensis (strain GHG001) TaxID=1365824 RepID=V5GL15_KALBG|nr:RNA recognition motif domain protein [Kalmanozyma brasiliensis GHG001]EST06647.1 RNA recognition motif domain protein [Kalmanozyma brasiliensis GHG001]